MFAKMEMLEEMKKQIREGIKLKRPSPNSIQMSIDKSIVDENTSSQILNLDEMKKNIGEITGNPEDLISFEAGDDNIKLGFSGEEPANKVFQFLNEFLYGDMLDKLMKPFLEMMEQMKKSFGAE